MDKLCIFLLWHHFSHSPNLCPSQATTCSWLRCTSWAMPSVWNTPTTPPPSWLLSTSTWTRRTSNYLTTTCRASRKSTVTAPPPHRSPSLEAAGQRLDRQYARLPSLEVTHRGHRPIKSIVANMHSFLKPSSKLVSITNAAAAVSWA